MKASPNSGHFLLSQRGPPSGSIPEIPISAGIIFSILTSKRSPLLAPVIYMGPLTGLNLGGSNLVRGLSFSVNGSFSELISPERLSSVSTIKLSPSFTVSTGFLL